MTVFKVINSIRLSRPFPKKGGRTVSEGHVGHDVRVISRQRRVIELISKGTPVNCINLANVNNLPQTDCFQFCKYRDDRENRLCFIHNQAKEFLNKVLRGVKGRQRILPEKEFSFLNGLPLALYSFGKISCTRNQVGSGIRASFFSDSDFLTVIIAETCCEARKAIPSVNG